MINDALRRQLAHVRDLEADWTTTYVKLADARNHALELAEELVGLQTLKSPEPNKDAMRSRVLETELKEMTGQELTDAEELIAGYLAAGGCPTCHAPRS